MPIPSVSILFMIAAAGELLDAAAEDEEAPAAFAVVVVEPVVVADELEEVDEPVAVAPLLVELPPADVEAHVAVCGRLVTCWPAHKALANFKVAIAALVSDTRSKQSTNRKHTILIRLITRLGHTARQMRDIRPIAANTGVVELTAPSVALNAAEGTVWNTRVALTEYGAGEECCEGEVERVHRGVL